MDTGLVCYLVGLQEEDHALKGPMAGALFETACVSQLFKKLSVWSDEKNMYFFRSTDGVEVDILLESGSNVYPLEIKLSSTIISSKVRNIPRWIKLTHKEKDTSFVISTALNTSNVTKGLKNLHFSSL